MSKCDSHVPSSSKNFPLPPQNDLFARPPPQNKNFKKEFARHALHGGENPQDALSLLVIFRKKSFIISGSFALIDLQFKASIGLRHPVCICAT